MSKRNEISWRKNEIFKMGNRIGRPIKVLRLSYEGLKLACSSCRSQDFHPSTNAKVARKQSRHQCFFIPREGKENTK